MHKILKKYKLKLSDFSACIDLLTISMFSKWNLLYFYKKIKFHYNNFGEDEYKEKIMFIFKYNLEHNCIYYFSSKCDIKRILSSDSLPFHYHFNTECVSLLVPGRDAKRRRLMLLPDRVFQCLFPIEFMGIGSTCWVQNMDSACGTIHHSALRLLCHRKEGFCFLNLWFTDGS